MEKLFADGGWVDLSNRTKLRLTGADRERFLQGQVSNDVRLARPDEAIYACVMTVKGKMSADVFIRRDAGSFVLDAEPELLEPLAARLERYIIADDVTLEDVTDGMALVHTISPRAGGTLPADLVSRVSSARACRFGRDGVDFLIARADLDAVRVWLGEGEIDAAGQELLRISEGVPRWGVDLAEDTIPVEAGLEDRAISYTKGCYIGQEVISRIKSVGRVNRHLRKLRAPFALQPGDPLESGGKAVGEITSAAPLPAAGGWLALGYLRRGFDGAGARLQHALGEVEVR